MTKKISFTLFIIIVFSIGYLRYLGETKYSITTELGSHFSELRNFWGMGDVILDRGVIIPFMEQDLLFHIPVRTSGFCYKRGHGLPVSDEQLYELMTAYHVYKNQLPLEIQKNEKTRVFFLDALSNQKKLRGDNIRIDECVSYQLGQITTSQ